MLISLEKFIKLINGEIHNPVTLHRWKDLVIESMDKTHTIQRPSTEFDTDEKAIILYCNNELWKYLKDIQQKGFDHLTIVEVAKIYTQIKLLLKG